MTYKRKMLKRKKKMHVFDVFGEKGMVEILTFKVSTQAKVYAQAGVIQNCLPFLGTHFLCVKG